MGLYSITQTLSNPDCGLSKPHIPDNTPYISHRLIHSNRQGPHPQINHMTCLFFTHNSYHLFAFFHRTYSSCLYYSHFPSPFLSVYPYLSLVVSIYSVCSLLISTTSVHSQLLCLMPSPVLFLCHSLHCNVH